MSRRYMSQNNRHHDLAGLLATQLQRQASADCHRGRFQRDQRRTGRSEVDPLRLMDAGEGGCTGVGAAIASAVADALGRSAPVDTIPLTPRRLRDLLALPSDPP